MRILSLLPAATEIVHALGLGDALVGVTHECDFPPAVRGLPRVTGSPVDVHAAPGLVNAQVAEMAAAGGALFTLDEARIAALAPDVVLTQRLCDVCAVSEVDVRALAARLAPAPRVATLGATTLGGVLDDVRAVAAALGAAERGEALVASLEGRLRAVHERLKAARAPRPRVAVVEWTDPVFLAGHWGPEMVRRAGGTDALMAPGAHSTARPVADLAAADPEVVLVAPCGYDLPRAAAEARRLLAHPEWAWLAGRRVWAVDANALVSRPGPRLVDGVEAMAAAFAPELFAVPAGAAERVA